eukprot:TRINITY_DN5185_c0_g1_i2.p2 TRINITY_DN5185_c0_g1~~TRINITY_DN5185_c0_g1_i2.p2  ORF type:complete len:324 (+),score=185.19 TRINITY_DN5185_c0_g1_i2:42-1013(+)
MADLFGNELDSLFLDSGVSRRVSVHPVVVFNVVDHHSRRPEEAERVIGALLGVVSPSGEVDVRDSFPVPHTEDGKVAVDMQYHRTMLALQQRASPNLQVVGWYSSTALVDSKSVMFHGFFVRECAAPPIHVTVDTAIDAAAPKLRVDAYHGVSLTLGETVGSLFVPVESRIALSESEKIGLHMVARAVAPLAIDGVTDTADSGANATADADDADADAAAAAAAAPAAAGGVETGLSNANVTALLKRLRAQLATLRDYAGSVVDGKQTGDAETGAAMFDVLQSLPALREFTEIFGSGVDDVLMVSYLAKLSRTQLSIAEQIEKI